MARPARRAHRIHRTALLSASLIFGVLGIPQAQLAAQTPITERDVVYGYKDGMAMVYDVVRPADPNGAGVVFVISGGFLSSRENQDYIAPVAQPLLDAGFTIFNLRHPSTPTYLAPDIYEAVKLGMAHVLENADRFGVDRRRVGTMGMSTGGLLALLLALDVPHDRIAFDGGRPAASVAYMPVVDLRDEVGNVQATPSLGFPPELAPALSPVDFVSGDDPPVMLIHGSRDEVVPLEQNSLRLRTLLDRASLANDLVIVEAGHELFEGDQKLRADRAAVRWFEEHLLR